MRLMKTFGLAAVVVMAFTATVEVGSAMAETQLEKVVWCRERTLQTCPNGKDFPAGIEIFAFATSTEFLTSLNNISCAASELHMTNTILLVHGNVTALGFGECKGTEGEKCIVIAENLEYLFRGELVNDQANSKYEIRFTEKAPNGVPQITFECGLGIDCTYTAKAVSIEARLAFTPEKLKVSQAFAYSEGFLCGETLTWDGEYNVECLEKAKGEFKRCWTKMEN